MGGLGIFFEKGESLGKSPRCRDMFSDYSKGHWRMGIIAPVCGRYLPTEAQPAGVALVLNPVVTAGRKSSILKGFAEANELLEF